MEPAFQGFFGIGCGRGIQADSLTPTPTAIATVAKKIKFFAEKSFIREPFKFSECPADVAGSNGKS
jgi:hypothetical protein